MALRSMKKRYLAGELEFKSLGEDNKVYHYNKSGNPNPTGDKKSSSSSDVAYKELDAERQRERQRDA